MLNIATIVFFFFFINIEVDKAESFKLQVSFANVMVTYLIQLNKSFTFNQTLGYRFHKELLEFAFVSTLNLFGSH